MGSFFVLLSPFVFVAVAYFIAAAGAEKGTKNGRLRIVPSIVPWFGNFYEFQRDPVRFMRSCRQKYGPAYKFLIAGQKIIVLSHAKGIAHWNRHSTDSFTAKPGHIRTMKVIAGVKENHEHLFDVLNTMYPLLVKALSPTSMTTIANDIDQHLQKELCAVGKISNAPIILQLHNLISRPLYRAGCLTLFGPTFPLDSFDDFHFLHSKFPQLIRGLPFMAHDVVLARQRILATIKAYVAPLWAGEAIEGVSDIITTIVQEMRATVTQEEAACLILLFMFGFHSNTWDVVFWLLSHLLIEDNSIELLRNELLESKKTGSSSTPLLTSAVTEILRWASAASSFRMATKDTSIMLDGEAILVEKGEFVMVDVQSLHYDPTVYSNPDQFKIDRFLDCGSGVKAPKPTSFGGGAHMCPGRHLATFEVKCFLTTLLRLYKVKAIPQDGDKPRLPHVNRGDFVSTLRASEVVYIELSPIDT